MASSIDDTGRLIERAREGDPLAEAAILAGHRDRLRRLVASRLDRRLAARIDPSDVIQEALADASRRLSDYLQNPPLPLLPWLRQFALERLAKLHRHHLRGKRSVDRERPSSGSSSQTWRCAAGQHLVAGGTSPSGRAIRDEDCQRVRRHGSLARAGPQTSSDAPHRGALDGPDRDSNWNQRRCSQGSTHPRAPSRPTFPRGTAMILNGATSTAQEAKSDVILAELVDRFIDRFHAGEWVDARAFAAEHPKHAAQLLEILPAAATMATLRGSLLRSEPLSAHFRLDSDAIGGYRILREIGRGGMGVVYEAMQVATGQKVALKVLPISSAMDPRQIERFRIEGQAAATLDHPHIVPVFEIGCEKGIHFYAMRFVEGSSLAALVHAARSGESPACMSPREAARLAVQAADALAHAHGLGIVHRDIKPANLLLEPAGHLWVADFGLAHFMDGGDLTQTGDVIGTLRYLSPEQAKGRRKLDARTDVYSLGATLYELVTLHPAFDGHDRHELLRQIVSEEPIPPRRLDPTIPRDLETILASAMAKEVDDRYGSATELADDLRRFLGGRPILARRPDAPTRAALGSTEQGRRRKRDDRPRSLLGRHGDRDGPALARTGPDSREPPGRLDRPRRILPLHDRPGADAQTRSGHRRSRTSSSKP